jgi:16S rRNA (uracil1498-N3)-methyltransferase
MHRFYLTPEHCAGAALRLHGREAHHALRVLRVNFGEMVSVLDGIGNEFLCMVDNCARDAVTLSVSLKNFTPAPPCPVTLLVAVPKGKIIEDIIQKAVELGASRIVPLLTERVATHLDAEAAADKRDKWQLVAVEAIKQCGTLWLPAIETPTTIQQFLARPERFDFSLVGSLQTGCRHPRECFQEFQAKNGRRPQSAAVWIGPEGDFTLEELQAIQNSGAQPVTLGKLVLRVETAAVYCLSILNYEMNGPNP